MQQHDQNKIPVIAIIGPTASGKTELAAEIALRRGGEIVSADSMQVYQGMDIASAKPGDAEKRGIPHHMMDFLPLGQPFNVVQYVETARQCIFDIHSRGKLPIVAGGTGLYVDSLLQNIDFGEEPDTAALQQRLRERMETEGPEALHRELTQIDPETARELHPNNKGRVLRALTVFYSTGMTMSGRRKESRKNESPFHPVYIGITFRERQTLYDRIDLRVEHMLASGLPEEVRETMALHGKTSVQAIGHKELLPFINGELSFEEAVESLKRETRRYAKRQLTWFRKNPCVRWFYKDDYDTAAEFFAAVDAFIEKERCTDA
ncbi:MAG: tRNA (adenosine(37)-N6)-dimethylallyltransferase MiaA [Oscillospiraceae bacterium]|jgi:tRNA dimethylallyltransferase|nr:tRNA (adenosine(37)-N6)-dimethylallyltransferase MiaA [Oscillospiraceae bacterium]